MRVRFVLAPQAALDLVEIWRYTKQQTSLAIADRFESAICEKIEFLARTHPVEGSDCGREELEPDGPMATPRSYAELVSKLQISLPISLPKSRRKCPIWTDFGVLVPT
jgi:plasmid stabilization system protein ParE